MRLMKYQFDEPSSDGWHFSPVELGNVNLIVGDTGSGKTRFLNTIFNLGLATVGGQQLRIAFPSNLPTTFEPTLSAQIPLPAPVLWKLTFQHKGVQYEWEISTSRNSLNQNFVEHESLKRFTDQKSETLVTRNPTDFTFQGSPLPRMRTDSLSVSILREEDAIRPIHEGFSMIMRRNFFSDALQAVLPVSIPEPSALRRRYDSLYELYKMDFPINLKLKLLTVNFPDLYRDICDDSGQSSVSYKT